MAEWVKRQSRWFSLSSKIRQRTGSEDSDDLLQTVLLRLLEGGMTHIQHAESYILKSAHNAARDENRRTRRLPCNPLPDEGWDNIECPNPSPDEVFLSREQLAILQGAIQDLDPSTREIFLLHRTQELSYGEISQKLGCSVSKVEKHISKALAFLTSRLLD